MAVKQMQRIKTEVMNERNIVPVAKSSVGSTTRKLLALWCVKRSL